MARATPDLDCDVSNLAYDFETKTGTLNMPPMNCCDMSACIALFEKIDPGVKRIDTFSGKNQDTSYVLQATGWKALPANVAA